MIVPGVLGMNVRGAMVRVAMDLVRANGREASGSRGSYGQSDQRERENQMSQGTKQAHGGKVMTPPAPRNPIGRQDCVMMRKATQCMGPQG
jgi:hypothetical protein